jgi:hypothetical protein
MFMAVLLLDESGDSAISRYQNESNRRSAPHEPVHLPGRVVATSRSRHIAILSGQSCAATGYGHNGSTSDASGFAPSTFICPRLLGRQRTSSGDRLRA